LLGPYAFQLTGSTDISGTPQPTASLGRLVFDGSGKVSGTASAMLSGFLMGNPVTGTYEAKPDCSISWQLQDDSGAFQHFGGKISTDLVRAQFKQTDPGGAPNGILEKTSDSCSAANLLPSYDYKISGSTTPMQPNEVAHTLSVKGTIDVAVNGSFLPETDCSVRFSLTARAEDGEPLPINMRGFLVNGGKEILAFQTDPGAMVAARLVGRLDISSHPQ
jgi:hypothetical protein